MKTVVSKAFPCINYILVPISFQETGPKGPKVSILLFFLGVGQNFTKYNLCDI